MFDRDFLQRHDYAKTSIIDIGNSFNARGVEALEERALAVLNYINYLEDMLLDELEKKDRSDGSEK